MPGLNQWILPDALRTRVWALVCVWAMGGCGIGESDSGASSPLDLDAALDTDASAETGLLSDSGGVDLRSAEEILFDSECAGCHGADGDSGSAPNLSQMVPRMSDELLFRVIDEGSGTMPGGTVEEDAIPALILYLRERFPGES